MKNEKQMEMLIDQVGRLANQMDQLNTEISGLNQGQNWDGTIVDALNEIAKALDKK